MDDIFDYTLPKDLKPMTLPRAISTLKDASVKVVTNKGKRNSYTLVHDKDVYFNQVTGLPKQVDVEDITKQQVIEIAETVFKSSYMDIDED
jgi:hypothetical protein